MLFRVLIILICVLYIIRKLAQIFLPMLFKSVIQNAQQNAQQNFRQQQYQQQPKPDGRVKVDYVPETTKSKVPDSEGEFVDYEEIK